MIKSCGVGEKELERIHKKISEMKNQKIEWNGKIKKKYSIEYHNYNERYWFTINQHTSCHTKKQLKNQNMYSVSEL